MAGYTEQHLVDGLTVTMVDNSPYEALAGQPMPADMRTSMIDAMVRLAGPIHEHIVSWWNDSGGGIFPDEKVKMSALDPISGFLSAKIDDDTIKYDPLTFKLKIGILPTATTTLIGGMKVGLTIHSGLYMQSGEIFARIQTNKVLSDSDDEMPSARAVKLYVTEAIQAAIIGGGTLGDMLKSQYDTNNDGIVDNTTALNGQIASYYLNWTNFTNTPTLLSGYGITDVYTKTELQTTGQSSIHWGNITNVPTYIVNGSAQYQIPITGATPFTPTWTTALNLVGVNGLNSLTYASDSFVKMTGTNTFSLDTNTYSLSNHTHAHSEITSSNTGDDHTQYALLAGRNGDILKIDTINEFTAANGVVIDGLYIKDTGINFEVGATTRIFKDVSNNLSFTDAITGTKTLAELAAGNTYTFSNGLTESLGSVKLGGVLTNDTSITFGSSSQLFINNTTSYFDLYTKDITSTYYSDFYLNPASALVGLLSGRTSGSYETVFEIKETGLYNTIQENTNYYRLIFDKTGLYTDIDFSSGYTDRHFVDKGYVDSQVGGAMIYPGAGIPISTGSAWSTSITIGTSTTTYLRNDGVWGTPATAGLESVIDVSNVYDKASTSKVSYTALDIDIDVDPSTAINDLTLSTVIGSVGCYDATASAYGNSNNITIGGIGAQTANPFRAIGTRNYITTSGTLSTTNVAADCLTAEVIAVYGEIAGIINTSGGANLDYYAAIVGVDNTTGNHPSYAGYFVGDVYINGTLNVNGNAIIAAAGSTLSFFGGTGATKATALTTALTTVSATAPSTPDYAWGSGINSGYGFNTGQDFLTMVSVLINLQTRVNELETKLKAYNLLT